MYLVQSQKLQQEQHAHLLGFPVQCNASMLYLNTFKPILEKLLLFYIYPKANNNSIIFRLIPD